MNKSAGPLSEADVEAFQRDGYLIKRRLADESVCSAMQAVAELHLGESLAPIEYEVDVQYPGAPRDATAEGGQTPRRLLHAYARHRVFREWGGAPAVADRLKDLFGTGELMLSQCHHNCIMTKHPGYSSATLWHQDNRYWSFDQQDLISVWLALGPETRANGCLRVIPGSHLLQIDPGRFDAALFLRTDLAENKALLASAVPVELDRGDVLFFHSRLFHAAGRNRSSRTKLSVVFTYHRNSNRPIENTRSAQFPGVAV